MRLIDLLPGRKKITKKCQRNLAKFRSTDFDYAKFVRKFYMEKGDAHISAAVDSINDIVNSYSVRDYEWINKEFAAYIEECAYYIPIEYAIVLEIEGCPFTAEQQSTIRRVIDDYFGLQLGDKIVECKTNLTHALAVLGGGVVCLTTYILCSTFFPISMLREAILIMSWFFLWEFGDRIIFRRRTLLEEKTAAGQLYEIKTVFIDSTLVPEDTDKEEE